MRSHRPSLRVGVFDAIQHVLGALLITSILLIVYGLGWEYSTREYLHGFADAVVPYSASPQQKVEAILAWMKQGPARNTAAAEDDASRNPEDTLNYSGLLQICGTATNAFVNLADSTGLQTRRLLLLGPSGRTTHEVAEVLMEQKWMVADPAFRMLLKSKSGALLTRYDLAQPQVFEEATAGMPNYSPDYNYQRTAHVRMEAVPFFGRMLEIALDRVSPQWDEWFDWTLLAERQSYAVTAVGVLLLLLCLGAQKMLGFAGAKYFGVDGISIRRELSLVSALLHEGAATETRAEGMS